MKMNNTAILIDTYTMLRELEDYNPYEDRFLLRKNTIANKEGVFQALSEIIDLEKIKGTDFRNYDYNKLNELLRFIYGENVRTEISKIISLIHRKIIKEYLNIPHLSKLYNETYFEYEWEMHSSLDKKRTGNSFYRDHFFHQARNLYEAQCLFKIDDIRKKIIDYIKMSDSNVARYLAEVESYAEVYFLGNAKMNGLFAALGSGLGGHEADYFKEYAYTYMIKGALFVASLVHDIGYPVDKQLQKSQSFRRFMTDFIPDSNVFEFESVRGIIESSLLFQIVGVEAIRNALVKDKDSYDHGVLSALVLLVYYYKHGTINQLNPLQRAIIEVAAIICFDHTATYGFGGNNQKRENYPCYAKTPLSIWFRLFDDIQEWDRVYFEIRTYSSLKICRICKKPIVRYKLNLEKTQLNEDYIINNLNQYAYKCACELQPPSLDTKFEIDYGRFKQQLAFDAKTLNYIIACNRIYYFSKSESGGYNRNIINTDIFIDYNPYRLLDLLRLSNCNFHSHRYDEIKTLQRFVKAARIEDININIIAFMEIEPDLLKQKIIYDFFRSFLFLRKLKKRFTGLPFVLEKKRNEIYREYKFDFEHIKNNDEDDKAITMLLSVSNMKRLEKFSLFYYLDDYNELFPQASTDCTIDFSEEFLQLIADILGAKKEEVLTIISPYIVLTPIEIHKAVNIYDLSSDIGYTINSSIDKDIITGDVLEKIFRRKISQYVDGAKYSGASRCTYQRKNIVLSNNKAIDHIEERITDNLPDRYYSDLYYFAKMNDFTEMVKELLSQNYDYFSNN